MRKITKSLHILSHACPNPTSEQGFVERRQREMNFKKERRRMPANGPKVSVRILPKMTKCTIIMSECSKNYVQADLSTNHREGASKHNLKGLV